MGRPRKNDPRQKSKIINEFIGQYNSKNTKFNYQWVLTTYFRILKKNPDTYFDKKQNYQAHVKRYWKYLTEKSGYAPTVIHAHIGVIKVFLEDHGVDFKRVFWRRLKQKNRVYNKPITRDKAPRNHELKQILSHGGPLERAFFLMQSSSGMRIGEVCQIELNDLDLENDPPLINIRPAISKNHMQRITFITPEAKEHLEEYLKVRKKYLKTAVLKSTLQKKTMNDQRVFPYSTGTMTKKLNRMLRDSGFDDRDINTKYRLFHSHTNRKFFETRLSNAGVPADIYQILQGHEGYLSNSYKRYTEEELGEWYKKGMHALLIFETQPDLTGLQEDSKKKDEQIKELMEKIKIQELRMDVMEVKLQQEKAKKGSK